MSDLDRDMKGGRIRRVGTPEEPTDAVRLYDLEKAIHLARTAVSVGGGFPSGGGRGERGPQGPAGGGGAGTQGAQGNQGNQGLSGGGGVQGNQGPQGFQGAQGLQGFQGLSGSGGVQGNQGNQGFQGLQGVQGPQGFQGLAGTGGVQGNQGNQGAQGPQGFQGFQGFQGLQGLQGPQGNQGNQGLQGFQGFQGIDGSLATLDSAYDGGGSGAGRTITVDAGPVQLTGAGAPATPGHLVLDGTQSITSAAGATWNAMHVTPDVTVTGATNITTAAGFNMVAFDAPTISSASALTITTAATLYIAGPPVGGGAGPATITNAYAINVNSGIVRVNGKYQGWSLGVKTIELDPSGNSLTTPLGFFDAQAFETGLIFQGTNYPAITVRSSTTSGGQLILQSKTSTSLTLYRWSWYVEDDTLVHWNGTIGDVAFWFLASGAFALNDSTYRTVRFNARDGTNPQIRASFDGTNYGQLQATSVGALQIDTSGVAGVIFNEAGADRDLRAEGDSLTHFFFLDATATTENAAFFAAAAPNWQTMDRGFFIGDTTNAPTGNPASGGFLYSNAGAGTWRGSGGTVTAFGPAGPHCGACGYDAWSVACFNDEWKSWHYECGNCGETYKGGPKSVLKDLSEQQTKEILTKDMTWEDVYQVVSGKR